MQPWNSALSDTAVLDVSADQLAIVRAILHAEVGTNEVWAFGSRVDGRAKPFSDLDLAIISETPLPLSTLTRLADAFSASDLPWRVDLVDWATTSEAFRRIIEQRKLVIQPDGVPSVPRV